MIIPWRLTGTNNQQSIVTQAFERIKFPFELLTLPGGSPELGWRDLNGNEEWWKSVAPKGRMHGDNMHDGDKPESLAGEIEGRKWIMGVFFPSSARIFLDLRLEHYPELAQAVVGAEIAHAVDEFLPMTDAQRTAIMKLWHPDGDDGHTWWEKEDYGREYYTLGGEAFMHEFVNAYSDIDFGDKSAFGHHDIGCEPHHIWDILGIARTDAKPVTPSPGAVPPAPTLIRYGKSRVFHRVGHKMRSTNGQYLSDAIGLRPCKVCKPDV